MLDRLMKRLHLSIQGRLASMPGFASAFAMLCVGAGCRTAEVRRSDPETPLRYAAIYDRAEVQFASAEFFKPRAPSNPPIDVNLAPLIIQQCIEDDPRGVGADRFGTARFADFGMEIAPSSHAVYVGESTALLHGRPFPQLVFVWIYPVEAGDPQWSVQGVRVTLNVEGAPIVWEVLTSDNGVSLVFVARSIEEAAARQFGPPLPQRRYAVERSISDQPYVVVARVIEDAPMPMGPFVYLMAGTRNAGTVICRCMPSQVDQFADTIEYDLLPLDLLGPLDLSDSFTPIAFDIHRDRSRLERILRFPDRE